MGSTWGQIKNIKLHIVTDIKGQNTNSSPHNHHHNTQVKMAGTNKERTFIMIKPDGVARNLTGKIIERFEQRGYKLVAMKFKTASKDLLEKHYADLSGKGFFPSLIKHIGSGPVVPMVFEGKDVVKQGRAMMGETDPLKRNLDPFVVTFLLIWVVILSTEVIQPNLLRRKLTCGSIRKNLWNGNTRSTMPLMNDKLRLLRLLLRLVLLCNVSW